MKLTKFTAGLVALSIATAGFAAAPARAGDNDAALVLGGLATLFALGKALDDKNKDKVAVSTSRYRDGHRNEPWQDRNRGRDFGIPNQCVASAGQGAKQRLVAFENCIERDRRAQVHLPRACETRVKTRQGKVDAYDVGCLTNFGYRVERTRDTRRTTDRDTRRN
ncbi:MAG: hypothetical protein EP336_11810 [Rhodobacteraceae bacterium]|nr:MAG: hypothetical protein EP336_11810 [Paracoccaceae bacterium]